MQNLLQCNWFQNQFDSMMKSHKQVFIKLKLHWKFYDSNYLNIFLSRILQNTEDDKKLTCYHLKAHIKQFYSEIETRWNYAFALHIMFYILLATSEEIIQR